jgi:hypothetical protein
MANAPKAAELFDGLSAKEAAVQHDEFVKALGTANASPKSAPEAMGMAAPAAPVSASGAIAGILANEELTKSMSPDALASLTTALDAQRSAGMDIVKDLTLTSPISTGLVAFDLEAPAKLIFPKMTPLRNKLPRKKGVGTSHRLKVINAITGSESGVVDTFPGITDSTANTFGAGTFNRGAKIGYAGYDRSFVYKQFSLSDNVPFSAQFQGQGYQDIRQLAQTTTLYASMLSEEKMLLMSRGVTADGNIGALGVPTATAAARTKVAGEVGLSYAGTYYIKVAADSGQFGASASSTLITVTGVTAGQVIDVTVADVVGAMGYEIFASSNASSGTGTDAQLKYQGRTPYNVFTLGGAADLTATGAAATTVASDTSAYATGYDGIVAQIIGASGAPSGYVNRLNAAFSTSNPGVEYQNAFASLYNSFKADPDEVLLSGADRKQLSDAIKSGSTANYRLNISQDEVGGVVLGDIITGLQNEVTGKGVAVTVHPWMPTGNSTVLSYTLPIPDSNVSDVWAVHNTVDYMAIEWPVVDFNYSNSVYWNGALTCAAPQFNGLIQGIKTA